MNEDLFPSRKDAIIANQQRIIKEFKAYDEKRTKHYKEVIKEVNWLREENKLLQDKLNGIENNGD